MKRVNTEVGHLMAGMVGMVLSLTAPLTLPTRHGKPGERRERSERGGSVGIQELLLIGLAIVVLAVIAVGVKSYVSGHLPK